MEYFLDMEKEFSLLEKAKYVLIPVPYDGTSTYIKGCDKGPEAIIEASDSIELYDPQFGIEAYKSGIHTDRFHFDLTSPEAMVQSVYDRVNYFLSKKKLVGLLGGEHSVSIGAIKAISKKYTNLSVLQIDAHADLRDEYQGSVYNHACVMRRAQEYAKVIQVGIRNVCIEEKVNIMEENIFYAHNIHNNSNWMKGALDQLTENVYLTIDLDGFDPGIMPATGTPLPGGLSWYMVIDFIKLLCQSKKIVGFDVVELCPQTGQHASNVLAATLVYKIITLLESSNH
jgi:agmatinase